MFREAMEYGLKEPELIDLGSDFRVNLYRQRAEVDQFGVIEPKTKKDIKKAIPVTIDTFLETADTIPAIVDTIPTLIDTIPTIVDTIPENIDTIPAVIDTIPENIDTISMTIDTIPETVDTILDLIRANSSVRQKEIQEKTGLSLSTVKRIMAELQKEEKIKRIGNNRSGEWLVR